MARPVHVSIEEARAITLRAQGFGRRWAARRPIDVLEHLGAIQLDSVNVVARSHDLIAFARMGPTPPALMQRAIYARRRGFEYWGHAASWLPMSEYRWFTPRMVRHRTEPRSWWKGAREKHQALYGGVLDRVRDEGPLGAAAFEDTRAQRGTWWDWKPAKFVLEDLFDQGLLMCASRTAGFARLYDVPERVLPPGLDVSDPGEAAAARHLLQRGFAALGVATEREAADYFRLRPRLWHTAFRELQEAGEVREVRVPGWKPAAWAVPAALDNVMMRVHRPTFLSPFDNLVWERNRTERLFGFRYRIEIYTPGARRKHGYYVLPFLARGRLAGRADVKHDRARGVLSVPAFYLEDPGITVEEVAGALKDLAEHLGAERIEVARSEGQRLASLRAALRG